MTTQTIESIETAATTEVVEEQDEAVFTLDLTRMQPVAGRKQAGN